MFPIKEIDLRLTKYTSSEKLFDLYRLVDYRTHEVWHFADGELVKYDKLCYAIWRKGIPCRNCISKHTCITSRKYFKIEFLDESVFLILSLPVDFEGKSYSLELAADVTQSLFLSSPWKGDNTDIIKLVEDFNNTAITDSFTGLYNKNYVFDQLINFLSRKEKKETLYVQLISVDSYEELKKQGKTELTDRIALFITQGLKKITALDEYRIWAGICGENLFGLFFVDISCSETAEFMKHFAPEVEALRNDRAGIGAAISLSMAGDELLKQDTLESFISRINKSLMAENTKNKLVFRRNMDKRISAALD